MQKNTHIALTLLIVNEDTKIYVGEKAVFARNCAGKPGYSHEEKWNLVCIFHPAQKINSEWIKGLTVRYETLNC